MLALSSSQFGRCCRKMPFLSWLWWWSCFPPVNAWALKPCRRTPQATCRARCLSSRHGRSNGRWPDETERHCFEVLHNGGKVELVAGAAETAKAHALEAMLDLKMCKAHLYAAVP
jgi:hypothetical protein